MVQHLSCPSRKDTCIQSSNIPLLYNISFVLNHIHTITYTTLIKYIHNTLNSTISYTHDLTSKETAHRQWTQHHIRYSLVTNILYCTTLHALISTNYYFLEHLHCQRDWSFILLLSVGAQ